MVAPTPGTPAIRFDGDDPPEDADAETSLLACVVSNPSVALAHARNVSTDDFARPQNRCLWIAALAANIAHDGKVDALLFQDFLKREGWIARIGGGERLKILCEIAAAAYMADKYAKKVCDASAKRAYWEVGRSLVASSRNGSTREDLAQEWKKHGERLSFEFTSPTKSTTKWRTLDDIEAATKEKPREWRWEGFLASGTVGVIAGEPKGGKSEILAAYIAKVTRGEDFLGNPVPKGTVVLVTEEGDHDLLDKLDRYGVDRTQIVILSRDVLEQAIPWDELVKQAVAKAVEVGAILLVIDTFSFWAQIEGEGERIEGIMLDACRVLQRARNANLATALVHHTVKGGGKGREAEGIAAMRSSFAFAANVEAVGIFRRYTQNIEDQRRRFDVYGRMGCSTTTVERMTPDAGAPYFRELGSESPRKGSGLVIEKIVKGVTQAGGWVVRRKMEEVTGVKSRSIDEALPRLVEGGRLIRMVFDWERGSPFAYAATGTPAATAPTPGVPPRATRKSKPTPETRPPA